MADQCWREDVINNKSWHEDKYMKMYFNQALQDSLKCSHCRRYLSVGPVFYKNEERTCGRCFSKSASEVQTRGMVQDHLYGKLLPHLVFNCSYTSCEEKLLSHQMDEHEINCTYTSQFRQENHELHDMHKRDKERFVTVPNVSELREKLSCNLCKKPLSVLPVISNGKEFICGRCTRSKSADWSEQKIFAVMAAFMKFPCANQGCTQVLITDDVAEHERICRWANTQCPLLCGEVGRVFEMSLHIREKHLHQAIDHLQVEQQTVLCTIERDPYIVSVRAVDEQQYSCAVYGLDEKEYDKLYVEIFDENNEADPEYLPVRVVGFKQNLESKDGIQFRHSKKSFLRLAKVEHLFAGVALDEDQSDHLECKVCYHYMTGKVFRCENNHRICENCKVRVGPCPMCRGVLADERDLEFETRAAKIRFPCTFSEINNCKVTLAPQYLVEHEARCRPPVAVLPPAECWFAECDIVLDSSQNDDFVNHCATCHRSSVVHQANTETIAWSAENDYENNAGCKVLFFDGEVFLITYRFGGGANFSEAQGLDFSVVQKNASSKMYKYSLELDSNGLIVERKGTCHVRPSKLGVDVKVGLDVVKGMLNKDTTNCCQSNGLLAYRVKLKKDAGFDTVDPYDGIDDDDVTLHNFERSTLLRGTIRLFPDGQNLANRNSFYYFQQNQNDRHHHLALNVDIEDFYRNYSDYHFDGIS